MFKEELAGLPPAIQDALRKQIEENVRLVVRQGRGSKKDLSVRNYTREEISAMFSTIFDFAERIQLKLAGLDES